MRLLVCSILLAAPMLAQNAEFVADSMPTPSCHASTIVEVSPGVFMSAWFGGAAEGKPDVAIWGARRENGRWTAPAELAREPEIATYNPVLFRTTDGLLWLYYKFGPHPSSWTGARRSSRDGGRTWSAIEHLPAGFIGPVRAKPLILGDGTIVAGTSVESYTAWACWIDRSTDNGRTWTKHGPITVPRPAVLASTASTAPVGVEGAFSWRRTHGIIQPSVVPMGGTRLRIYARSTGTVARICVADSNDLGRTWTQARPLDLPNPNSGIDIARLKDGRFVLIYNHTEKGRTPLNLAVSRDGDHFTRFHDLETDPGEYSYPALIQASDGNLHMTYTWRRQKIRHVEFPLEKVPNP